MHISQFDFDLPKKLIAQSPILPRDYARMLIYHKSSGEIEEGHFYDLPKLLHAGDALVINNTKVNPVRLKFTANGRENEVFFLNNEKKKLWKCMVRPGKHFRSGATYHIGELEIEVISVDSEGYRMIQVNLDKAGLMNFLSISGEMPVPPYIKGRSFKNDDYNTIYAHAPGSVAAPTAGLHFTGQLISRLMVKGVNIERITLNVGLGTFLPVKEKDVRRHLMHRESYEIDHESATRLNRYIRNGGRIFAVGTTSVRTLESNYRKNGMIREGEYSTDIFIKPGYKWGVVQGMITNFHLPKSTLIMLVAGMIGIEETMRVYNYAISRGFRFYSFGDGMIIV